jgi:non-heme chloroperoxidase
VRDATLVGFSMGGGEVVRYISRYEPTASPRPCWPAPSLYRSDDNPDGGLDDATIRQFQDGVRDDGIAFLDGFTTQFFTAGDDLLVSEPNRLYHLDIAAFASPKGTLDCIGAFSFTDFREEVAGIEIPTLVIHGDSDAIVPFEVSGRRSHEAIASSSLVLVEGAPHGFNATHADEFNAALLDFLG